MTEGVDTELSFGRRDEMDQVGFASNCFTSMSPDGALRTTLLKSDRV